jgi:hypothetical protein
MRLSDSVKETSVKVRCESCSDWVDGSTRDRLLECECGKQYMISVTAVDIERGN